MDRYFRSCFFTRSARLRRYASVLNEFFAMRVHQPWLIRRNDGISIGSFHLAACSPATEPPVSIVRMFVGARGLPGDSLRAAGIIDAFVPGKWIAAPCTGRAFGYFPAARTNTVAHVATSCCNARRHARRVPHVQSSGPAAAGPLNRQWRSHHNLGHCHSGVGTDTTLRTTHAETGVGMLRCWRRSHLTRAIALGAAACGPSRGNG
jgi:hypothetical protein